MRQAATLIAIIFLIGCDDLSKENKTDLSKLEDMRENWDKLELTDYEYIAGRKLLLWNGVYRTL